MIAAGAFVVLGLPYLQGDLWFDECLTLGDQIEQSFAACFQYNAANNHMLYSALLWLWVHLTEQRTEVVMRLPGLMMALGSLYLLYRCGRGLFQDRVAGLLLLMVLAFSPVYVGFFWQLRGYSLSILLAIIATMGALHIVRGARRWGLGLLALGALPLPGVIPSNLLVNYSLVLFLLLHSLRERRLRSNVVLLVSLAAIAGAGVLVYAPVAGDFVMVLRNTSGWDAGSLAAGHWLLAAGAHCGLVTLGLWLAPRLTATPEPESDSDPATAKLLASLRLLLIVCLAVPVVVLLVRAPFPRVFLPFLGPLTFAALAGYRRNALKANGVILLLIVLVLGNYLAWTRVAGALERDSRRAGVFRQNLLQQYYAERRDVSFAANALHQSGQVPPDARVFIDWHYFDSFRTYWGTAGGERNQIEALGQARPPHQPAQRYAPDTPMFAAGYSTELLATQFESVMGGPVVLQPLPLKSPMPLYRVNTGGARSASAAPPP